MPRQRFADAAVPRHRYRSLELEHRSGKTGDVLAEDHLGRPEEGAGGAFELWFGLTQPEGSRGCEACKVHSVRPMEQLVFEWNGKPQSFGKVRVDGKDVLESFSAADAQRFVEAVRKRKAQTTAQ